MSEVLVLGAGVIGLSTAIRVALAGHRVRVWARDPWPATTSAVSAAIWFPYLAEPRERVLPWAQQSYAAFQVLATVAGRGVVMREALIVARARTAAPWWRELLPAWRAAPTSELPAGATFGDLAQVPVAEMPLYLPFLERQAQGMGVQFESRAVRSPAEALAEADVVVNFTGLGAREVAGDARLFPIRGQVVSVADGATRCVVDDDNDGGVTYVVPRSRDVVLGGTCAAGDSSLEPRADETAAIHTRCAELVPALGRAGVTAVRVGLRPGRDAVRLERERIGGKVVVHNYGHGGCGMTLSWGCADEVVDLLSD